MTENMIELRPNRGIPRSVLLMMSIVAGLTVANLYYNQPLLEEMKASLHATSVEANFITVITQIGYALGLLFVVPMADMYSRRKILFICMSIGATMSLIIALSPGIIWVWGASIVLGACSVVPQIFVPMAGRFSKPENKARNMGYVLSGLLSGILAARVISGFLGDWFGWRMMFGLATFIMLMCLIITLRMVPRMASSFEGNYRQLMHTVASIFLSHPRIRINSLRAAFAFGSMMSVWSCLAFHLADRPFYAGSDQVGILGLCGIVGAMCASGVGKYIPRFGVLKISLFGNLLQFVAWTCAYVWGESYVGLIAAIILVDIGVQCQQLSNQSDCLAEVPEATNRANTIFMTSLFAGGSLGTFCAGWGWETAGWVGVVCVGLSFAASSLLVSVYDAWRRKR